MAKPEITRYRYCPITPAGSLLVHLEAETEQEAWEGLLADAAHMPYAGIEGFKERGYTVIQIKMLSAE